jgi:hypothetical protein
MAGVETMNDVISTDVIQDPDFKNALKAWSGCMARNGYTSSDADALALQELTAVGLRAAQGSGPRTVVPGSGSGLTAAQNRAQIATAVTDANCTLASDLAGIYFAVQASYEQQVIDANQQALNAAVREYKASYARELSRLPALLRTTSAAPALIAGQSWSPGHAAPGHGGRPGPRPLLIRSSPWTSSGWACLRSVPVCAFLDGLPRQCLCGRWAMHHPLLGSMAHRRHSLGRRRKPRTGRARLPGRGPATPPAVMLARRVDSGITGCTFVL